MEQATTDERTQRYADAAAAAWDSGEFPVSDAIARAVIALADAEQAELRAKVTRVEALVDGHSFAYVEWDTGVPKCKHPSHASGYSASCPQAWLADALARIEADQ